MTEAAEYQEARERLEGIFAELDLPETGSASFANFAPVGDSIRAGSIVMRLLAWQGAKAHVVSVLRQVHPKPPEYLRRPLDTSPRNSEGDGFVWALGYASHVNETTDTEIYYWDSNRSGTLPDFIMAHDEVGRGANQEDLAAMRKLLAQLAL
jgi:hypothetical protein